jgi:hypothetical protein
VGAVRVDEPHAELSVRHFETTWKSTWSEGRRHPIRHAATRRTTPLPTQHQHRPLLAFVPIRPARARPMRRQAHGQSGPRTPNNV